MINTITDFVGDYRELKTLLIENGQISLENNIEHHLRKIMLLSCASYYENEIQEMIKSFVSRNSNDEKVLFFVSNKAIARQYHTYFDWGKNNINQFLGLFGTEFKEKIQKKIDENAELKEEMKAFLTIGDERNKMVHNNFISYKLDKTFDEIISLNDKAESFVSFLKQCFEQNESCRESST